MLLFTILTLLFRAPAQRPFHPLGVTGDILELTILSVMGGCLQLRVESITKTLVLVCGVAITVRFAEGPLPPMNDEIFGVLGLAIMLGALGLLGALLEPDLRLPFVVLSGLLFVGFLSIGLEVDFQYHYPIAQRLPFHFLGGSIYFVSLALPLWLFNWLSISIRKRLRLSSAT